MRIFSHFENFSWKLKWLLQELPESRNSKRCNFALLHVQTPRLQPKCRHLKEEFTGPWNSLGVNTVSDPSEQRSPNCFSCCCLATHEKLALTRLALVSNKPEETI